MKLLNIKPLNVKLLSSLTFERLSPRKKVFALYAVSICIAALIGPCSQFFSSRYAIENQNLERGKTAIKLLAALNASNKNDASYDTQIVAAMPNIKDAFITDANGLVLAPANRFHEDARRDPLVLSSLETNEMKIRKNIFGLHQLAMPIFNGKERVGVARIDLSILMPSIFWPLVRLFETGLIMAAILLVGFHFAEKYKKEAESLKCATGSNDLKVSTSEKNFKHEEFNNLTVPVFVLDKSFSVSFANVAANERGLNGKHIVDIGKEYMEMAEEMEMLQKDKVMHGSASLWKMKDGNYGLQI